MVRLKVLLFAHVREWFRQHEIHLVLSRNEWPSSESLKLALIKELEIRCFSQGGPLDSDYLGRCMSPSSLMLVINEEMIVTTNTITLRDDDIVTLVPPVSGG